MKLVSSNLTALLICCATVSVCFGYTPFKGTRQNGRQISLQVDPDNPPPEHGRSVYDPEIYNKYTGIQFQDQIPVEELEEVEDKKPHMPAYPWRGGGHEPLPLDDPEALKVKKKEYVYLIGFRNCDELLDTMRVDGESDDDDDEEEEAEEELVNGVEISEDVLPENDEEIEVQMYQGRDECSEAAEEVPPENEEPVENVHPVENVQPDEEGGYNDVEGSGHTEKGCPTCCCVKAAQNFPFLGVGAVSDVGSDFANDNSYISNENTKDFSNLPETDNTVLPGVGEISRTESDYVEDNSLTSVSKNMEGYNDLHESKSVEYSNVNALSGNDKGNDAETGFLSEDNNSKGGCSESQISKNIPIVGEAPFIGGIYNNDDSFARGDNGSIKGSSKLQKFSGFLFMGADAASVNRRRHNAYTYAAGDHKSGRRLYSDDEDGYESGSERTSDRSSDDDDYVVDGYRGSNGYTPYGSHVSEGTVVDIVEGGIVGPGGRGDYEYLPDAAVGDEEGEFHPSKLSTEACRACLPCCAFFAERAASHEAMVRRRRMDECSLDEHERDFVVAECRSCHVRRRPMSLGVVLTCYECAQQQADTTCRLGIQNPEFSQYRVSAKFFLTTGTNDTGEIAATQHTNMIDRRPFNMLPLYTVPSSVRPATSVTKLPAAIPSFMDIDDADLYPFEDTESSNSQDSDSGFSFASGESKYESDWETDDEIDKMKWKKLDKDDSNSNK